MGATKINIRHVDKINTEDLPVLGFELCDDNDCRYVVRGPVEKGEIVLIKASFKDLCEGAETEDETVLYRRRVVPFVTRIKTAKMQGESMRVSASIERITDEDRAYFFRKYFDSDEDAQLQLDLEGKRIHFASAM